MIALWETLGPWDGSLPEVPALGYRGAFLHDETDRTWQTYGGAVTLEEPGRATTRRDQNRAFERLILSSAPAGTLPDWARADSD